VVVVLLLLLVGVPNILAPAAELPKGVVAVFGVVVAVVADIFAVMVAVVVVVVVVEALILHPCPWSNRESF